MFLFTLATRIAIPYGYSNAIPTLRSEEELNKFLHTNNHSVIIFGDYQYILSFMDLALYKYGDKIATAMAPSKLAGPYECKNMPCFRGFRGEKAINFRNPVPTLSEFTTFYDKVLETDTTALYNTEQIRKLFFDSNPSIFAVDHDDRPSQVPKDVHVNLVSSKLMKDFGVEVEKGVYVYVPEDKQLVLMTKSYEEMIKTKLCDANPETITSKPYFIGFNIDDEAADNVQVGSQAYDILSHLSGKYSDKANFGFINGAHQNTYIKQGKLHIATKPYLVIFNSTDLSPQRWLIQDHNMSDIQYYDDFVGRVIAGKEPFTLISAPIPAETNSTFKEVVATNFKELVIDNKNETLVAVTAPWCGHCKHFKPILNEITDKIVGTPVNIYWFDGTTNDFGPIPEITGYPTLFMWPSNNKTHPVQYEGNRDYDSIIDFINTTGQYKFPPKPVNETKTEETPSKDENAGVGKEL